MDQYVGMTALGSILQGPDPAMLYTQMETVYPDIFTMFNTSEVARVRYVTGWVIQLIAKNVPALVFKSRENLELLINSGCTHLEQDHSTIRGFMANAFSDIFEAAARMDQKPILNSYFNNMISAMMNIQFSNEALKTEQFLAISGAICTCFELCDAANLREQTMGMLNDLLAKVSTFIEQH